MSNVNLDIQQIEQSIDQIFNDRQFQDELINTVYSSSVVSKLKQSHYQHGMSMTFISPEVDMMKLFRLCTSQLKQITYFHNSNDRVMQDVYNLYSTLAYLLIKIYGCSKYFCTSLNPNVIYDHCYYPNVIRKDPNELTRLHFKDFFDVFDSVKDRIQRRLVMLHQATEQFLEEYYYGNDTLYRIEVPRYLRQVNMQTTPYTEETTMLNAALELLDKAKLITRDLKYLCRQEYNHPCYDLMFSLIIVGR